MHIQAVRLFKHRKLDKCHKLTEIWIRRRDAEMAARCGEMEFNLDGEEGDERVENVTTFLYLGLPLEQTDDDWPTMRQNIMHTRSVWGRLGTLLLREGEDTKVLEKFYRAVVQAIILYWSETWVLSVSTKNRIEGTHTEFLRMIIEKRTKQLGNGT